MKNIPAYRRNPKRPMLVVVLLFMNVLVHAQPDVTTVRDSEGHVYTIRKMSDGKKWMTANLNATIPGSYGYDPATPAVAEYGRVYTWSAAQEGCKTLGEGWRLPTNEDWRKMASGYGGVRDDSKDGGQSAFRALITGGDSGFNAVYGGGKEEDENYARVDAHGFYWTATESDSTHAWFYNLGRNGKILNRHVDGKKQRAISVRCISDL